MYNVSAMFDALAERFDDMDEIKDVAEYGCSAGVSDFIYSSELCEFFDKYEDEIEDELDAVSASRTQTSLIPTSGPCKSARRKLCACIVEMCTVISVSMQPVL